jgi:hypothetical protein
VVEIPPFVIHSLSRADSSIVANSEAHLRPQTADHNDGWQKYDAEIEEWTVLSDGAKELFFRASITYWIYNIPPITSAQLSYSRFLILVLQVLELIAKNLIWTTIFC